VITEIIPTAFLINIVTPPNSITYVLYYIKGELFVNSDERYNDFHVDRVQILFNNMLIEKLK